MPNRTYFIFALWMEKFDKISDWRHFLLRPFNVSDKNKLFQVFSVISLEAVKKFVENKD